jgi:ferredoxin-NADP reductase
MATQAQEPGVQQESRVQEMTVLNHSVREWETTLVVDELRTLTDGVVTLQLSDPNGQELPAWTPGAHIDLILSDSLVRQYSLCSLPRERGAWRVGVLRAPGSRGGSEFVHSKLSEGSSVRVRGPRNHFPLVASPRYLFIAGGIGITPMLPMIETAEATGADWRLVYGGRSRSSMAFLEELERYANGVDLWPEDERGMLDVPSLLGTPQPDILVYCCGPAGLMRAVEDGCAAWPAGSLHLERFAPKTPDDDPSDALDAFDVVCQRSGVTVPIEAEGGSILEQLEKAGIDGVFGSCYEGICGTCECPVLEGEPAHRDSVLTADQHDSGDVMIPCVSGSRSKRLVLDV